MAHKSGFIRDDEPAMSLSVVNCLHVVGRVAMPPARLQAISVKPKHFLHEAPLREYDFNFAEVFNLDAGQELILPQHFVGLHAIVVLAGSIDLQTQARGGIHESHLCTGQVAFVPLSYARLPTRTLVSTTCKAKVFLAATNPAQFC